MLLVAKGQVPSHQPLDFKLLVNAIVNYCIHPVTWNLSDSHIKQLLLHQWNKAAFLEVVVLELYSVWAHQAKESLEWFCCWKLKLTYFAWFSRTLPWTSHLAVLKGIICNIWYKLLGSKGNHSHSTEKGNKKPL